MRVRILILLVNISIAVTVVVAHPHIGVDVTLQPETENGVLEGVLVTWAFDLEAYSIEMLADYDLDNNGTINAKEEERIRTLAFENVENYSYFLFVGTNDGIMESPTAESFQVTLAPKEISYRFYLPYRQRFEVSSDDRLKSFTFTLKDPTGFMSVSLSEFTPISLSGGSRPATYLVTERVEQFTFAHDTMLTGEMIVKDILFFPTRG